MALNNLSCGGDTPEEKVRAGSQLPEMQLISRVCEVGGGNGSENAHFFLSIPSLHGRLKCSCTP